MNKKLLLVYNDLSFQDQLEYIFSADGYRISKAINIKGAMEKLRTMDIDMVLIDMQFNDGTGLDLLKTLREEFEIPVIVVSVEKEDLKKILAFEYGVDDYIIIPFNTLELKARIRTIFRRVEKTISKEISENKIIGDFNINIVGRKVILNNVDINLTGKEFDIFYTLIINSKNIFSRADLVRKVWGNEMIKDLRTLDVHIRRIREKIETVEKNHTYIQTRWGKGYFFQKI